MKRKLIILCAVFAACIACVADTFVDWSEYQGTYSGTYTDVNRWDPQTYGYPGSIAPGETGFVYPLSARWNLIDANMTVTFAAGETSTPCNFDIFAGANRVVEFSGADAIWELPATSANAYRTEAIRIGAVDANATLYKGWDQWGSIHTEKTASFNDFWFRVSATNGVRRLDFLSGTFALTPRTTYFFDGVSTEDMAVTFASGATVSSTVFARLGAAGPHNTMTLVNQADFKPFSISFVGTDPTHETTLVLDGSSVSVSGAGSTSASAAKIVLRNGSALSGSSADINHTTASSFAIELSEASTLALRNWNLGNASGAHGSISVAGGSTFSPGGTVKLGGQTAEVLPNSFGGLYFTNSTATVATAWTVNNGEMVFGPGTTIKYQNNSGALAGGTVGGSSRLLADGVDVMAAWGVSSTASAGVISGFDSAELTENGLTFRRVNNYVVPSYVVPQDFKDAAGHEGKLAFAEQINAELTGTASSESVLEIGVPEGYRVTMKGGARHYSNVFVKNGGALCLQGATQTGATFKSLTLGASGSVGVLELDADEPVTVDGPINFVNGQLKFGTTLSNGPHTVFITTSADQTGTAVSDWMFKKGFTVASGVTGYYSCRTVEQNGQLLFQIHVSDSQPTIAGERTYDGTDSVWDAEMRAVFAGATPNAVELQGEAETASMRFSQGGYTVSGGKIVMSDVTGAAIEALAGTTEIDSGMDLLASAEVNVASGSKLTLGGNILGVGITKTGEGELAVEAPAMTLADGFVLKDGSTTFGEEATYNAALGLAPDTSSKLVVVRADEDVTMSLGSVSGGSLVKWGSGRLTLNVDRNMTLAFGTDRGNLVPSNDYDLSDYSDTAAKPHGPIGVAEGELVIRGTSATRPAITVPYPNDNQGRSHIGLRTVSGSVVNPKEPGLVIDHASVTFTSQEMQIGFGLAADKSFARAPYLVVTNGSHLSVRNFNVSEGQPAGAGALVFFESSSLSVNQNYANNSGASVTNVYTFVNGSTMFNASSARLEGSVDYSFNRSGWYGSNSNSVQVVQLGNPGNNPLIRYAFRNGSRFNSNGFVSLSGGTVAKPITVIFDDSEWFPGAGDRTIPTTLCNVTTKLEGSGIVVNPSAGDTWTFNQPMVGEGGFTMKGEGTFVFDVNTYGGTPREDAATLCYSGMTDVQDGTLVVSENAISNFVGRTFRVAGVLDMSGQTLADAVVATAGGTIRNAALSEPRFVVGFDGEGEALPVVLDYANGFTMSGRVVFDFGAETGAPYAKGTVMTVARWTGAQKPDISRWRAVNVGEGLKCLFDAKDDGTITARIVSGSGLVLFVR